MAEWLAKDPVDRYRQRLLSLGVAEPTLDEIDAEARDAVERATDEAKAAQDPDPGSILTEVWYDGGSAWRN